MPFRPMWLRGGKVFARCDAAGSLVTEAGKVEIRYKPGDGRAYFAVARNLAPHPDAALRPDEDFGAAQPVVREDATRSGGESAASSARPSPKSAVSAVRVEGVAAARSAPTSAEPGEVVAYADGACSGNPGPAGLGVVMLTSAERRELSEYLGVGTNNIAELTAILRAAEAFPTGEKVLRVYTDSSYAIGVLGKGWKAKANVQLVADVKKALAALPAWELHHVRGHKGVPLNERADQLAVAAVEARATSGWQPVRSRS